MDTTYTYTVTANTTVIPEELQQSWSTTIRWTDVPYTVTTGTTSTTYPYHHEWCTVEECFEVKSFNAYYAEARNEFVISWWERRLRPGLFTECERRVSVFLPEAVDQLKQACTDLGERIVLDGLFDQLAMEANL